MGASKPQAPPGSLDRNMTSTSHANIIKKRRKGSKVSHSSLKHRNGLLNAAIPARSEMMQIARRNSIESPLLRLPGEIRTKIWEYAVGYHQINIHDYFAGDRWDIRLTHDTRPLHLGSQIPRIFVQPTFGIPKVCRQMYVEASPFVYSLNKFGFDCHNTFDRWIKNRALGQRRLVMSVDIPFEYYDLYNAGFRKLFRQTFPNIEEVGLHIRMAQINQKVVEHTWCWRYPQKEPLEATQKRHADAVKTKEGLDLKISWHNGTSSSLTYMHYR